MTVLKSLSILLFLSVELPALQGQSPDALFQNLSFRSVGPSRGGRVTAVCGVPQIQGTYYMGATGGGVWKTVDYGQSWKNCSDGFFASPSIGAMAVAASNPSRLVVGTGSDGLRSNVIVGKGVYRSDDAGESWRFIGLPHAGQIGAVLIDPTDEDRLFVAALGNPFGPNPERGVYRSTDGGAHWSQVLFISDTTGVIDLEFAPDNPSVVYASAWRGERKPWTIISGGREGGVYRSTDGGDLWRRLGNGLPQGLVGKSDLAVSAADPRRLYVLMEAPEGEGGLYRSDDRGETFRQVSSYAPLLDRPFYYCNIDADPQNADKIYVSATGFWKSSDAGASWQRIRTPHGDNHDLWIDPADSLLMVQCNDGGANVTRDGGKTWSTQHNQNTAELYQVHVDDRFPYWLYAGQQDNATIRVASLPPYRSPTGPAALWQSVGGCETGPAVPKPGDADIVYANCKGRFGRYNQRTGQEQQFYVGAANLYGANPKDLSYRFQRVAPILVSPHNPHVIYHASQFVHKTTDEGRTWATISPDLTAFDPDKQVISGRPITRDITGEEYYSCLYVLAESPVQKGVLWAGANDGPIHVSRNGGATWTQVTPPDLPPGGRVQTLEASPHAAGKAYACVLRYQLDDWRPHVYRTEDFGASWTSIVNGLPVDQPVRVVREDPEREGLLFAGTEFGLYVSFNDGAVWQPFQRNLPVTPVTDMKIAHGDLVLSTMGRGFWIMDDIAPLRQWSKGVAARPMALFTPSRAVRMRYSRWRRRNCDPAYPAPGAVIDYWLADAPEQPLVLEILKGETVIRRFSSQQQKRAMPLPSAKTGAVDLAGFGGARLPALAGHNRFIWDLRHAGAWRPAPRQAGRRGPLAVPGRYTVRLSLGDAVQTAVLNIEMDPRVAADSVTQSDLEVQLALRQRIGRLGNRARLLAHRLEAMEESASTCMALLARLKTAAGRYPRPMLIDQIGYLDSMLSRADQRPGRDAYERLAALESECNALWNSYRRLTAKE